MQQKTTTDAEQMLRDIIKAAADNSDQEAMQQASALLTTLQKHKDTSKSAERIYNTRQYKSTRYSRAICFQESQAVSVLFALKTMELRIFLLLERLATRSLIRISVNEIALILKSDKRDVRRAVKSLIEKHIIYVISEGSATAHTAAVYKINTALVLSEKEKTQKEDLADLEALDWTIIEQRLVAMELQIDEITYIDDTGRKRKCVCLTPTSPKD